MKVIFTLDVSYGQLCVFDGNLPNPFNDWSDEHVRQGFSWRKGSACFRTLNEGGPVLVEVGEADHIELKPFTTRAISVPFTVVPNSSVEVATVTESKRIEIEPGEYQLVFEAGILDGKDWCRFTFVKE